MAVQGPTSLVEQYACLILACIQDPACDVRAAACLGEVKLLLCCLPLEPANVCAVLEIESLADTPIGAHAVAQVCKEI